MRLRAILFAVVVLRRRPGRRPGSWPRRPPPGSRPPPPTQLETALERGRPGLGERRDRRAEGDARRRRPRRDQPLPGARDRPAGRRRRGASSDTTTLAAAAPLPPPPFALELLRNEAEVSLIGLVPETGGRDVIRAALGAGGLSEQRHRHAGDRPPTRRPTGWQEALGFGLSVLAELPRAKISVAPRRGDGDRRRRQRRRPGARWRRGCGGRSPRAWRSTLEISAPRPVIAPFAFDFSLDGRRRGGSTPAAPTARRRRRRSSPRRGPPGLAGGRRLRGRPRRALARLGRRRWRSGLEALQALGGGRFTPHRHRGGARRRPRARRPTRLAAVGAALDAALPDVFRLTTVVPPRMAAAAAGAPAPCRREFEATLSRRRRGAAVRARCTDATSRDAILSYAAALFGHDRVMDATEIDPGAARGLAGAGARRRRGAGGARGGQGSS